MFNREIFTFEELLDTLENLHFEINDNDLLKQYSKLEKSWESICSIETLSVDKNGANILKKIMIAINLKKSAHLFFFSIPPSNACVERVFSIMGNIWRGA